MRRRGRLFSDVPVNESWRRGYSSSHFAPVFAAVSEVNPWLLPAWSTASVLLGPVPTAFEAVEEAPEMIPFAEVDLISAMLLFIVLLPAAWLSLILGVAMSDRDARSTLTGHSPSPSTSLPLAIPTGSELDEAA